MSNPTPRQLAYTGAPTLLLGVIGAVAAGAGMIWRRVASRGAKRRLEQN